MEELWVMLRSKVVDDLDSGLGPLYPATGESGEGPWIYGAGWGYRDKDGDEGLVPPPDPFDDGKVSLRALANDEVAAFRWVWRGRDVDERQRPAGAPQATGRSVEIHGMTLAWNAQGEGEGEGEVMVQRFTDWAGLFAQLGMSLGRPVFDDSL